MQKTVKTNQEFLGDLFVFSPYGTLVEIFIIEAIRKYAEDIASTPEPTDDGKGFISAIAWHGCATDVLAKLKENYENRQQ